MVQLLLMQPDVDINLKNKVCWSHIENKMDTYYHTVSLHVYVRVDKVKHKSFDTRCRYCPEEGVWLRGREIGGQGVLKPPPPKFQGRGS